MDGPNLIEQHQAAHRMREELRRGDAPRGWEKVIGWVETHCCSGAPIGNSNKDDAYVFCPCSNRWPNTWKAGR